MNLYIRLPGFKIRLRAFFGCLGLAFLLLPYVSQNLMESLTPICGIQGAGFHSPHQGKIVRTQGVVHGDLDDSARRGFFMQDENCDWNQNTSDGIFVYLDERLDIVNQGDRVEVVAKVEEYFGLTELAASPDDVSVLSSGNTLPKPVDLNPPYKDDESSEYFESLEGMRVSLAEGLTIGPTDYNDRSWLVRADLGVERVFQNDPRGTGEIICVGDYGRFEIDPEVKVGDSVHELSGVQDYEGGEFCMQLFSQPSVYPRLEKGGLPTADQMAVHATLPVYPEFRVATINLANLFDTTDDPDTDDPVLSASEYQRRLGKRARAIHDVLEEPEIIALQEAENRDVLQSLVNRPEIIAEYQIVWQDGPDRRGLDVALLYRLDRVQVLGYETRQGCTTLVDGLGPDGNRDISNPVNTVTCDTDNDGNLEGNRLFSRPPLVIQLKVCENDCAADGGNPKDSIDSVMEVWLVAAHFKSKLEDSETTQYTLPRRIEQAQFVTRLLEEILGQDPSAMLIVLGDLNDHPDSIPLLMLEDYVTNQIVRVSPMERYTYIFKGRSQALDHILVSMRRSLIPAQFSIAHINADFPNIFETVDGSYYRSSDHDPLMVGFLNMDQFCHLPIVLR